MSESLPETALSEGEAVPPVGDAAPSSDEPVGTESAPGEAVVPAARFNGLMGKFHQTQSALEKAQQRIAELEASSPHTREDDVTDTPNTQIQALQEQVSQLTRLMVGSQVEAAKQAALREFPEAAAFADLIVADSPESVREMAQVLAERVRSLGNLGTSGETADDTTTSDADATNDDGADQPTADDAVTAPVVVGGTTAPGGGPAPSERVQEAISKKDFRSYLQAKREQLASAELALD